jgi:hypothetical protein
MQTSNGVKADIKHPFVFSLLIGLLVEGFRSNFKMESAWNYFILPVWVSLVSSVRLGQAMTQFA